MAEAREEHVKDPEEVLNVAINCTGLLAAGESFTGTPEFTSTPPGLTFSNAQFNAEPVVINDVTVAAGKALLASVEGGESGKRYVFRAKCGTDSTPAQTRVAKCRLFVKA